MFPASCEYEGSWMILRKKKGALNSTCYFLIVLILIHLWRHPVDDQSDRQEICRVLSLNYRLKIWRWPVSKGLWCIAVEQRIVQRAGVNLGQKGVIAQWCMSKGNLEVWFRKKELEKLYNKAIFRYFLINGV